MAIFFFLFLSLIIFIIICHVKGTQIIENNEYKSKQQTFYIVCMKNNIKDLNTPSNRQQAKKFLTNLSVSADLDTFFKEAVEEGKQREEARKKDHLMEFYEQCKKNHILDLNNAVDRTRAETILRNMMLFWQDADEFFQESQKIGKQKDQKEEISRLNAIRTQEKEMYDDLTLWANDKGREKRVGMLKFEIRELKSAIDSTKQLGIAMMNSAYQEPERDWAVAGGLGGVGAAVDAQLENIEIRARNKANQEAVNQSARDIMSSSLDAYGKLADLEEKLEKAKIALVADEKAEDLLKIIDFSRVKHSITKTGAVHITGTINLTKKLVIFDKINAVIDGTIFADVYQNGTHLGNAAIVLPCFGISTVKRKIETICLCNAVQGQDIEIRYYVAPSTGDNLGSIWAMEK